MRIEQHMASAVGGAGMLHNIAKPLLWRGGTQVIEHVFEDAHPLKRVDVQRQEWKNYRGRALKEPSVARRRKRFRP